MAQTSLVGRSILVIEDEPFVACCLQMILEGAGADIHRAANLRQGLHFADRPQLSAAVLDSKHGIRDDHAIARRLTERGLPFVLYGADPLSRHEAWPDAPVVSKLASGTEIIETLCALILPQQSLPAHVASKAAQPPATLAMAHVEALLRRRGLARRPYRSASTPRDL
jgi:CheY-like chemotaxis protein